jgi:hypothetical protein
MRQRWKELPGTQASTTTYRAAGWRMRPAGVPAALGVSYRQVVYRAVVRCGPSRGVYFLRSDADSRVMNAGGNLLSFFRFHHATVAWTRDLDRQRVTVASSNGTADIDLALGTGALRALPGGCAFPALAQAKEHLVDLFTRLPPAGRGAPHRRDPDQT